MTFLVPIKIVSTSGDGKSAFDSKDESSWKSDGKGQHVEVFFEKTVNVDKIDFKFAEKDGTYEIYYKDTINDYVLAAPQFVSKGTKEFEVVDVDLKNITSIKIVGLNDKNEIIDVRFDTDDCNCCKPICECEPVPVPVKEDKGRVKDWGSTDEDPKNFKVVNMKNPKNMFKVIDKDGINKADMFNTKAGAEKFIKDYKPDNPDPKPDPNPTDVSGVKLPFTIKKETVKTNAKRNERDDGLRLDYKDLGKKGEFVNSVQVFYGTLNEIIEDDITFKWSWARHTGSALVKAYGIGLNNKSGNLRGRMEWNHPSYTSNLANGKGGLPLKKGTIYGYAGTKRTLPNGNVLLEYWQDQGGLVDGKPANKWVKLLSWEDSKYKVTDYSENGCELTTRIDTDNGFKDVQVKITFIAELA